MSIRSQRQIQILHVDDEPDFADLTTTFLERENDRFTVETATSADEGLEQIDDRPPDCIVSDYNMPGMDGLKFLQTVREEYPDLPFILFTGKGSEAVAGDAISAGVTDYLQKQGGTGQYELLANRIQNAVTAQRDAEEATRQQDLMRQVEILGATGGWELEIESEDLRLTNGIKRIYDIETGRNLSLEEVMEFYEPGSQEEIRRVIDDATEDGYGETDTLYLQTANGEQRVVQGTAELVETEEDSTVLRGVIRDITDREERQREVEQARDLMTNMERLADVGAWEYDPNTGELTSTAGAKRIHGIDSEANLSLDETFEFYHPEDRERLKTRSQDCFERGEPYEVDVRLTTTDGEQRWVTIRGERVQTNQQQRAVRGYIRDITEEKRHKRQLTELNRTMQDLLMAETRQEVADIGVTATRDILDLQANGIHLSEADGTRLAPVAQTDELTSLVGEVQSLPVADSIAGRVYQHGEPTVIDDVQQDEDAHNLETDLRGHAYLPLAGHGILIAGSEERAAFGQHDLALGELVSGSLAAALNRIEREQALHEQQQKLALFFTESPLGAIQWDDEFRFERLNRRAEEILGYDETELRDKSWETIVAADDRDKIGTVVENLLNADGGAHALNRNVRKDGEVIISEWHNRAVTDADGNVRSIFSKFQDVTDRERRKSELQEYEAIIEALSDAVYVVDEEGRFTYVNDGFVELVGYDRETILGNTPSLIKDDDAVKQAEQQLGRLLSGDGPETLAFEVTIHPRNSDPVVCQDHMGVLPYEGAQFNGSVGTLREITEKKARERELQAVSNQYETLVENFPDGAVFLFDQNLRYVQAGGEELAAVGLSPDEVTGMTPNDLFPEELADETVRYYRETLDGANHTFEQEYDGDNYRIRTVPIRNSDEDITHGMAVSQNVTERAERRRKLKRQNERLEEFTSVVSHDLRSPLTVADGRLELAQEDCESPHLDQAADAIDRSQTLIEDLLTLAQGGQDVSEVEPVALADVAESSWETVEGSHATLEAHATQTLQADQSRLMQLFENLYRNAVEHGGDDVTVSVGTIDSGFYVADTGPGIPKGDREEVFKAGYSTNEEGTGFGLRIVRQVADAHGWEVAVTGSEQGGARFEITGVEFADK
jgi:PAS domain S-box-containing protein